MSFESCQPDSDHRGTTQSFFNRIVLLICALIALYYLSHHNYLLFHATVETFSVIVACGIFMIAWNSRRFQDNDFFLCIGIGSLFMGGVDFLHTLAYKNMGVFPVSGANLATQLWIVARYLEAGTLLFAPTLLQRRISSAWLFTGYLTLSGLALSATFGGMFPDCFREGTGLTTFKISSEYIICLLLAAAAGVLYQKRQNFEPKVLQLLFLAIVSFILAELSFTLYTDVFGLFNMAGHLLKVAGFYFIYQGVIETGLTRPYDLLFRELKESEQRYRNLYQNTPVMLHSIDSQGVLVSVSDFWLQHLGYEREQVIGQPSTHFMTRESRQLVEETVLPKLIQAGNCQNVPCRICKKDGEIIDVLLSAVADCNAEGEMIRSLTVMADVTEEVRYQQQVEALNKKLGEKAVALERANQDLEAFNYSVSHDLRGPLNNMNTQCQVLLESCDESLAPGMRDMLGKVQLQVARMGGLITTLLDFSRLNKITLSRQRVDLSDLAQVVVAELRLAQPSRTVTCCIEDGLIAEADENLLHVLLTNLLGNAWKYTADRAEACIEVGSCNRNGQQVFYVRDNGIGFDSQQGEELFTPFTRLQGAEKFAGFGIGLATVKRIVDRHDGIIWAESAPDEGATFYFSLTK